VRVLLIRRSKINPNDMRAYVCIAHADSPKHKFIGAGTRSTEACFKESESEVALLSRKLVVMTDGTNISLFHV